MIWMDQDVWWLLSHRDENSDLVSTVSQNQIDVSSGLRRLTSPDGIDSNSRQTAKRLIDNDSWDCDWRLGHEWRSQSGHSSHCGTDDGGHKGYRRIWTFDLDTDGLPIRHTSTMAYVLKKWILMPCWFSECMFLESHSCYLTHIVIRKHRHYAVKKSLHANEILSSTETTLGRVR